MKKTIIKEALIIGLLMILFAFVYAKSYDFFCEKFGDRYSQDSVCFDPVYRCTIECGRHNRNFSGKIDGCACDCGDVYVSACTGMPFKKNLVISSNGGG